MKRKKDTYTAFIKKDNKNNIISNNNNLPENDSENERDGILKKIRNTLVIPNRNVERIIDEDLYYYNDRININHNNQTKKHIDFIIGRGREDTTGFLNLPINRKLLDRNIIYIDSNCETADIKKYIEDVDFSLFNITKDIDKNEEISIRFIFDWSTFYCSALRNLPLIAKKLNRRFKVLVPLYTDENDIPYDIKNTLNDSIFTISLVNGKYPLFDWNNNINDNNKVYDYINKDKYIMIYVYDD